MANPESEAVASEQFVAFMQKMRDPKGNADAAPSSGSVPPSGGTTSTSQPHQLPPSNDDGKPPIVPPRPPGGGGSSGYGGGGHGGKSSKSHSVAWYHNLGLVPQLMVGLVAMIFIALAGQGVMTAFSAISLPAQEKQVALLERMQASDAAAKKAEKEVSDPIKNKIEVVTLPTKSCRTDEDKDQVFSSTVTTLDQDNASYEASPGCLLVKVGTRIRTFDGSKYLIKKEDASSPTGFTGCGTIGGANHSLIECLSFLNAHRGQRLQLTIVDGGYVNFN